MALVAPDGPTPHRGGVLDWVYVAKGIGVVLVVVGHFDFDPAPAYWPAAVRVIYSFHMPLFFVLAGYLYGHRVRPYADLLKDKSRRLLFPFISIAGLSLVAKYAAQQVTVLEHPVDAGSVYALLTDPMHSYVPLLWFVHALFLMFVLYPVARLALDNRMLLLLVVALNILVGSDYLVFGRALANMPFFVLGVMLREDAVVAKAATAQPVGRLVAPAVVFIAAYGAWLAGWSTTPAEYPLRVVLGFSGSLAVVNVSQAIATGELSSRASGALTRLGYFSMGIYLMHTWFQAAVRLGVTEVLSGWAVPFELVAIVAVACGLALPLVLERDVLRKYAGTRRFVLGLN